MSDPAQPPRPPRPFRPFRQGRFEDLPDVPTRPHAFHSTRGETVAVDTASLGRVDTHYRVHGSGPPLLVVHGLMTTSYSWRYAFAPLGERFTVYAPDLPGAGRSSTPDAPLTPDALTEWLAAFQRAVGIRGCAVIGNSMGGYLAMRLALRDPGAMSRLVNVHSPGVPEPRLHALRVALAVPGVQRALTWFIRRDPERWAHRNVHYYDESLKSREEAREYGATLGTEAGARAFVSYLADAMAIGPVTAFYDELLARARAGTAFPVPLLLVYAEEDPMVPPRFGDALARALPGARLVKLAGVSHFAHVDGVDKLLPPVLAFLSEPTEPRSAP